MLTEVIENAYKIFVKYHPMRPLDVCTNCCMTVEEENNLAGLAVRQIPIDLLSKYNDSAKPEKTSIDEIKHFLPRYLDLIGQFQFPTHSSELSFSRLTPFDKAEWRVEELKLLNEFSLEFFRHCLTIYPLPSFGDKIDTIIVMFWRADFNIDKLLENWLIVSTRESSLHLRDLYFHGFDEQNTQKLSSAFGDKELAIKIRSWLDSKTVKHHFAEIIEQLILNNNSLDEGDINDLNLLYEMLQIS